MFFVVVPLQLSMHPMNTHSNVVAARMAHNSSVMTTQVQRFNIKHSGNSLVVAAETRLLLYSRRQSATLSRQEKSFKTLTKMNGERSELESSGCVEAHASAAMAMEMTASWASGRMLSSDTLQEYL